MTAKLALLFAAIYILASTSWAANNGLTSIIIDGKRQTKYVLSTEGNKHNTHVNGTSITLVGGGRVHLGNSPTISPSSYYQMPLLGKRLNFNVDMSRVGCNCNGALYLLRMPAYNSNQTLQPGNDGTYYCDADKVGGTYCPDMDVMEANKYAMASTAHTCKYQPPHYYPSCDRYGCGANVLDVDLSGYGPGKRIDTNRPFSFSVEFIKGGDGKLSTVTNTFQQDDQTLKFNACNSDYLQWMGYSLPGIVMTMSLWGTGPGGMSWLDGKSGCQVGCNLSSASVTFSEFKLDTL